MSLCSFVSKYKNLFGTLCFLFLPISVFAHHSKDWLKVDGAVGAGLHQMILFSNQDYVDGGGGHHGGHADDPNSIQWSPGFVYGLTDHWAFEVHGDIAWEEGGEFNGNSVGFQPRWWTTLNEEWKVGLTAEYAIATKSEGHDHILGLAIFDWDRHDYNAALNIGMSGETEGDEDPAWIYKFGAKKRLSHEAAVGLEFKGESNEHTDPMEIILGYYRSRDHGFGWKVGPGFGLNSDSPDVTLNSSVLWSF